MPGVFGLMKMYFKAQNALNPIFETLIEIKNFIETRFFRLQSQLIGHVIKLRIDSRGVKCR